MSEGTIAISKIMKPRKVRWCEECNQRITGETIRIFGCAHEGDRPYPLYLCMKCAKESMCSDLITSKVIHPPTTA